MEIDRKVFPFEISRDLQEALRAFYYPDLFISPDIFNYLLQIVCEELGIKHTTTCKNDIAKDIQGHHKDLAKFKAPLINQWCGSLMTFLVKAAGEKASQDDVTLCLTTLGWTPQYASRVSELYDLNQIKIQTVLKMFQSSPPRLVDLRWRIDVKVESNTTSQLGELWYIVDIILEENSVEETFTFDTNHSQLEDLVATLKDACNSARRFPST